MFANSNPDRHHQVSVLLDLDETVMAAFPDGAFDAHKASVRELRDHLYNYNAIHRRQNISTIPIRHMGCYIYIINPKSLKKMIETIYSEGDDIIIFTAGAWDKALLSLIAGVCELSAKASASFRDSILLNVDLDADRLGLSSHVIRHMNKAQRLYCLFRPMPLLAHRHFVMLDDNPDHIRACEQMPYVSTVLATTDTPYSTFYDQVLASVRLARHPSVAQSPLLEALSPGESDDEENLDPEAASAASVASRLSRR